MSRFKRDASLKYDNKEVRHIISQASNFIGHLCDKKIELLAIGDDEFGATIQVRVWKLDNMYQFEEWLEKSRRKIKRMSWVQIEVSGHDHDGDYRSKKFKFENEVGNRFLIMCSQADEKDWSGYKLIGC